MEHRPTDVRRPPSQERSARVFGAGGWFVMALAVAAWLLPALWS